MVCERAECVFRSGAIFFPERKGYRGDSGTSAVIASRMADDHSANGIGSIRAMPG